MLRPNLSDADSKDNILSKVYKAIKFLDYFSFIFKNNEHEQNDDCIVKIPYFNFSISMLYHKKDLIAKSAKINIFSFNRELFTNEKISKKSINPKEQTYITRFTIFHKMIKSLTEDELNLYKLKRNVYEYKILKYEQEDLIYSKQYSKTSEFKDFLNYFNFTSSEASVIIKMLALILHISNLTLDFNGVVSENKLKDIKELLDIRELSDLKKVLMGNIKLYRVVQNG